MKKVLLVSALVLLVAAGGALGIFLLDKYWFKNDVVQLLAAKNISLPLDAVVKDFGQRNGCVVARGDEQTCAPIIAAFALTPIPYEPELQFDKWADEGAMPLPGDVMISQEIKKAGVKNVKLVWAVDGRPPQLRLPDGTQFQSFYLVLTSDGVIYLMLSYAYG
jgi:hypothetical protein